MLTDPPKRRNLPLRSGFASVVSPSPPSSVSDTSVSAEPLGKMSSFILGLQQKNKSKTKWRVHILCYHITLMNLTKQWNHIWVIVLDNKTCNYKCHCSLTPTWGHHLNLKTLATALSECCFQIIAKNSLLKYWIWVPARSECLTNMQIYSSPIMYQLAIVLLLVANYNDRGATWWRKQNYKCKFL